MLCCNCRLKREKNKRNSKQEEATENVSTVQNIGESAGYETIRSDYLQPIEVYAEIDEMGQIAGTNHQETRHPNANMNPKEYEELNATRAELATWREQVETGNNGPYQDLIKDNGMTEGDISKQYYNMPVTKQGNGSYSNVPLHSE